MADGHHRSITFRKNLAENYQARGESRSPRNLSDWSCIEETFPLAGKSIHTDPEKGPIEASKMPKFFAGREVTRKQARAKSDEVQPAAPPFPLLPIPARGLLFPSSPRRRPSPFSSPQIFRFARPLPPYTSSPPLIKTTMSETTKPTPPRIEPSRPQGQLLRTSAHCQTPQ